jgi:hypothetical protein
VPLGDLAVDDPRLVFERIVRLASSVAITSVWVNGRLVVGAG